MKYLVNLIWLLGFTEASLRDLGSRLGLNVGAAVGGSTNTVYRNLISSQYNIVVAETACKMKAIRPDITRPADFAACDAILSFARSNTQLFRGHTLLWLGSLGIPSWLQAYTVTQARAAITQHIQTVMGHYRNDDDIIVWDVVNYALSNNYAGGRAVFEGYFIDTYPDIVESAFITARAANPTVKLFYNDDNTYLSHTNRSRNQLAMISDFKARGIPIDGVGFQCHIKMTDSTAQLISSESIKTTFQQYQNLGLEIHVTELDVQCPLTSCNFTRQAEIFVSFYRACVETPACTSILTWGVMDSISYADPNTYLNLFDGSGQAKPSYNAVHQYLNSLPYRLPYTTVTPGLLSTRKSSSSLSLSASRSVSDSYSSTASSTARSNYSQFSLVSDVLRGNFESSSSSRPSSAIKITASSIFRAPIASSLKTEWWQMRSYQILIVSSALLIIVLLIIAIAVNWRRSKLPPKSGLRAMIPPANISGGAQEATRVIRGAVMTVNEKSPRSAEDPESATDTTMFTTRTVFSIPLYREYVEGRDFRVGKPLAKGGGAEVYFAEAFADDLKAFGNKIVLKRMNEHKMYTEEQQRDIFYQEVAITFYLQSCPHIVRLLGFSSNPRSLLLKLYPYGSLRKWMAANSKLITIETQIELLQDVSIGLRAMHTAGLLHADMKSDNCLIDFNDEVQRFYCVITDMGISQVVEDKAILVRATVVANRGGWSPLFASPEVWRNRHINGERKYPSDIYAFAVIMLEVLTKARPKFKT